MSFPKPLLSPDQEVRGLQPVPRNPERSEEEEESHSNMDADCSEDRQAVGSIRAFHLPEAEPGPPEPTSSSVTDRKSTSLTECRKGGADLCAQRRA